MGPTVWSQPGQAAHDFRSDHVTSPSLAVLGAIVHTTLLDDVMMEDPTTNSFQTFMAVLTGHGAAVKERISRGRGTGCATRNLISISMLAWCLRE